MSLEAGMDQQTGHSDGDVGRTGGSDKGSDSVESKLDLSAVTSERGMFRKLAKA